MAPCISGFISCAMCALITFILFGTKEKFAIVFILLSTCSAVSALFQPCVQTTTSKYKKRSAEAYCAY